MAKSLEPAKELKINYKLCIVMILIVFVVAFLLGSAFRHYPSLASVV